MNLRPAPTECLETGESLVCCAQGGAQPIICGTTGCHEETVGGYYCLECAAAYAERSDDQQWLDEQGPVDCVQKVTV